MASRQALLGDRYSDLGTRMGEHGEYLESEPHGEVRARSALVRQLVRGCLPRELTVNLAGIGELVLRSAVSEVDAGWLWKRRRSCEVVSIECAGREALVLVERGFALHTVNALLGHVPLSAVGSLSRIERGLFHGLLAALSARLQLLSTVGVCADDRQAPDPDSIVIESSIELRGAAGRAWLCASAEFLAQILSTQASTSTKSSAMVCLELARTCVPVSQLAQATEGDVVVFDEVAALPAAAPWPVRLRCGGGAIPASLRPDGILVAAQSDPPKSLPPSTGTDAEVAAELGQFQRSSLAGLLDGAPIGTGRSDSILLRLADVPWAEGEVIAFDDVFAVRITRKLAG